jgi:hypothetical protein
MGPSRDCSTLKLGRRAVRFYPKLCGTYEDELHPVVESILGKPYRRILDIGCARGYYLVGLGKLLRDADLIGVDTDNEARDRCRAMADLNGIEPDRLQLWETMEPFRWPATLVEKTLIICDCEGYEDELFDTEIDIFGKTDLIIECHDFIKPGITAILADRFARTHETQLIRSSSTEEKVSRLKLDSVYLNQLEGREKQALVSEGRPGTMNWLWLVAVSPVMKIVHLSSSLRGGAGIAMMRQHRALLAGNVDSRALYGFGGPPATETESQLLPYPDSFGVRLARKIGMDLSRAARVERAIGHIDPHIEQFSHPFSRYRIEQHPGFGKRM